MPRASEPRGLRVAALQLDLVRGDVAANLARVEAGLFEASAAGVRLLCLPEMWATSFVETLGAAPADWWGPTSEALTRIADLSGELGIAVAGSAFAPADPAREPRPGERLRNRLHVYDEGELVFAYDKVHLFSPTGERESFVAGDHPPATIPLAGVRVSGAVCYDLRFAPLLRVPYVDGAELLLVPAQWPETRAAHWRALVVGRAVEAQCFVLAVNRVGCETVGRRELELRFPGNSLVVGPAGEVLAEGRGEQGLIVADLDLERVERLRREVPVRRDQRPEVYDRAPAPLASDDDGDEEPEPQEADEPDGPKRASEPGASNGVLTEGHPGATR
ncbi:MAG: nitrilase-related carbon-nitrogen hydrolase [Planctomycetota bacterium]